MPTKYKKIRKKGDRPRSVTPQVGGISPETVSKTKHQAASLEDCVVGVGVSSGAISISVDQLIITE